MKTWADEQYEFIVSKLCEERDPLEMDVVYMGDEEQEAINAFLQLLHEATEAEGAPYPQADVMFVEGRHPDVPEMPIVTASVHAGPRFAAIAGITLDTWKEVAPGGQNVQ